MMKAEYHHHYQGAVSHIQPIAPSNELAKSISCKRAVGVSAKIWFVKAGHDRASVRLLGASVPRTPR